MRRCACVCRVGPVPGLGPTACVKQSSVYPTVYYMITCYSEIPYRACTRDATGTVSKYHLKHPSVYKSYTKGPAPRHATRGIVFRTVPNCRSRISDGASLQSAGPERIGSESDRTEPRNQPSNSKPLKPPELAPKPSTMLHAHATMWYKSASRFARNKGLERPPATRQSYHADDEGPITMELPPRDCGDCG